LDVVVVDASIRQDKARVQAGQSNVDDVSTRQDNSILQAGQLAHLAAIRSKDGNGGDDSDDDDDDDDDNDDDDSLFESKWLYFAIPAVVIALLLGTWGWIWAEGKMKGGSSPDDEGSKDPLLIKVVENTKDYGSVITAN
jgi:hypothetical protein